MASTLTLPTAPQVVFTEVSDSDSGHDVEDFEVDEDIIAGHSAEDVETTKTIFFILLEGWMHGYL